MPPLVCALVADEDGFVGAREIRQVHVLTFRVVNFAWVRSAIRDMAVASEVGGYAHRTGRRAVSVAAYAIDEGNMKEFKAAVLAEKRWRRGIEDMVASTSTSLADITSARSDFELKPTAASLMMHHIQRDDGSVRSERDAGVSSDSASTRSKVSSAHGLSPR